MNSTLRLYTVCIVLIYLRQAFTLDATLEIYNESPGLYYEQLGEARLYSTEWKIVTYVNLDDADRNLDTVKRYARMSFDFCKSHEHTFWINFTDCRKSIQFIDMRIKEVEDLKLLVGQLSGNEENANRSRTRRGVFNFIGGISKILFGTMDSYDESYYTDKISRLEKEQFDFLKLSKEQLTVVKSTLKSMNSTIMDVSENERILSIGLQRMADHVNAHDGEIKKMLTATSMMLAVNDHSIQLERSINECRRQYEILIDAIINSQKGVIQPHIITPAQIIRHLRASQADVPSDLSIPIPLSVAHHNLVLRIAEVDVFLRNNFLVYVVCIPLSNHVHYKVHHVLPLPIKIRNSINKFIFISPEREYLLMDTARQYFAKLRADEIKECKQIDSYHRVCKQKHPLQVTHLGEDCEAEMLQPIRTVPVSCSQRIVEINQTIWTQLDNNEWLFVAPRPDTLTTLCPGQEPLNLEIVGTGKLKLNASCKAYGTKVLIQAQMTTETNSTESDIIPYLSLEVDCCQSESKILRLDDIHLDLPLNNVINHLDDLRWASHKVNDVERIVAEQEWKMRRSNIDYHLSFLSYVGMITTGLTLCIFAYCCCCKCCRKNCPSFSKWWKDNNPCTTIIFKPKIVNSVHTSRESLSYQDGRPSTRLRNSQCDAIEVTELATLNPTPKHNINSGKR
jgi:hypothetical protein